MDILKFFGYLVCNTICTMLSATMIYYFLKINFKLEDKKNSLLFLVLSFGLINGVVASLWTNLFEISSALQPIKQILLLVLSVIIIKFSLKVNWLKAILAFVVQMLSLGVGNALVSPVLHIPQEKALSSLPTYILVNIFIYVITLIVMVMIQILIKLTRIVISKDNDKKASEH